jgi:hypothetical protein
MQVKRGALHGDEELISLSQEWLAYLHYLVHQGGLRSLMMDEMWMMAGLLAK